MTTVTFLILDYILVLIKCNPIFIYKCDYYGHLLTKDDELTVYSAVIYTGVIVKSLNTRVLMTANDALISISLA